MTRDPRPTGYNILFILSDQERYFDTWPVPLPGREKLKRLGVSFNNHQIASSVCSPSRSNIYTGRHTAHTGVIDNMGFPWQPDMSTGIPTIGTLLNHAGYYSAYLGKWHLSRNLLKTRSIHDAPLSEYHRAMQSYGFQDFFGVGDLIDHSGHYYDGFTTEAAVHWLRTQGEKLKTEAKPWFLAVNLVNPHDIMYLNTDPVGQDHPSATPSLLHSRRPYDDALYQARWPEVPLPASRRQPFDEAGRPAAHRAYSNAHASLVPPFEFTDERVGLFQDFYFNCLRDSDTHVRRLLDTLESLRIHDETIVIFTSDHGEYGCYHQMIDKGAAAFRQQNHVPLIISHPAHPGGKDCQALTSHIDLVPTMMGLAGVDEARIAKLIGDKVRGVNFSHLLEAPELAPVQAVRPGTLFAYSMLLYHDGDWGVEGVRVQRDPTLTSEEKLKRLEAMKPALDVRGALLSIFDGRFRFSRYFSYSGFRLPQSLDELFSNHDLELFDLEGDPEEMNNLAVARGEHDDLVLAMNGALNHLFETEVGDASIDFFPMIRNGELIFQVG